MADSSHNAKIEIDKGQTSSFTELAKVTTSNHDKLLNLIQSTEYGQDGEQRTAGRVDFSLSVDVNLDLTETTHTDLYDALRDGDLIDVRIYPDRDVDTYVSATCRLASGGTDLPGDGVATESFSFENADGSKWSYTTA